jgi:CO/xanthine dehydrogenase Mo-binding subunit
MGTARYTHDFKPEGMLHGVVVRSRIARGSVQELDLSAAEAAPGVVCVLGPQHVPPTLFGDVTPDEAILAGDDVRFVGQPLALVAAETLEQATAAARLVKVVCEGVSAAVDMEAARLPGAPVVRAGKANVMDPSRAFRGDVSEAFARDGVTVVETEVRTQRAHQGYVELRASLAEVDEHGRLVVVSTSQAPYQVRAALADLFGLALTDVLVVVPAFGGGFGGKLHNGMAPYASALALATGRPVQVVCPRDEELQASTPREGSVVHIRSAVTEDGRIVGREVDGFFDSGAYEVDTPYITSMGAMQACGPYDVEAVDCRIHPVSTNLQSTGSFRAPSGPQMAFALERHMDDIGVELNLDRLEVRRRNLVRDGSLGPTGQVIRDPVIAECLDAVEAQLESWVVEAASRPLSAGHSYGFGIACCWWFTAPGASSVVIRVEDDGGVTVMTGATEIGTGAVVSGLRRLVSSALGVEQSRVRVVTGSTDLPQDFGSEGSRTLYASGNASLAAVDELRALIADHLEAAPGDVEFRDGSVGVVGDPSSRVPLGKVAAAIHAAGGGLIAKGRFQASSVAYEMASAESMLIPNFHEPTFHCQGAWVVVDEELGHVNVLKYVAAHDVGAVIDWEGLRGQVEGGIVQGLGYALLEELVSDASGTVVNDNLADYRMPTAGDTPEEIVILPVTSSPSREGPAGAKGIGEAPVILPAAVIASAIQDATGRRLYRLPLRPDRVVGLVP